jgi:hypothetical protein
MKKLFVLMIVLAISVATFALADKGTMTPKVGDELYVCGCGDGCKCDMMSTNPAQCPCGKDLVKSKVTKVEEGKITMDVRNRPFVSIGKYVCACGPECKCNTISQNPGNCSCGKKMIEVKAKDKN